MRIKSDFWWGRYCRVIDCCRAATPKTSKTVLHEIWRVGKISPHNISPHDVSPHEIFSLHPDPNHNPNPNPNTNPNPHSAAAVTCLKMRGHEMNCHEMNCPVSNLTQ